MAALEGPVTVFNMQQYVNDRVATVMAERNHGMQETQARVQAIEDRTNELFRRAEGLLDEQRRNGQEMMAKIEAHQNQLQTAESLVSQIGGQGTAHEARMKKVADAIAQHEIKAG